MIDISYTTLQQQRDREREGERERENYKIANLTEISARTEVRQKTKLTIKLSDFHVFSMIILGLLFKRRFCIAILLATDLLYVSAD